MPHRMVEGQSVLLDGVAGRYPYNASSDNVVWPVSIDEQKLHSQVDHTKEDGLFVSAQYGGYIPSATEEAERRGQVSLLYQKRRLILNRLPYDEEIAILRGPLVQVDAVSYLDADDTEQTLATKYYRATKQDSVYFKSAASEITLADGPGVVWIDTVCGYGDSAGDVPSDWRELVKVLAEKKYDRRQLVAGGGLDEAFERLIDRMVTLAGGARRYV